MEMTRRQLLLLSLSALPVGAKGVLDWQRENLLIADSLQRAQEGELLFLKEGSGRLFHGYAVRARRHLKAGETTRMVESLVKGLRAYSIKDGTTPRFTPEYGLRLEGKGGKADVLISFRCRQLFYFTTGRPLHGRLRGGEEAFH